MKNFLFTALLIACFAISHNAFSQEIIGGNCPHFDPVQNCLTPTADGRTATKITVDFTHLDPRAYSGLEDSDWFVYFSCNTHTEYIPKNEFNQDVDGKYKYHNNRYFWFPVPNVHRFSFVLYLMSENSTVIGEPFVAYFDVCQGNNRLSNSGLTVQGDKNNSFVSTESIDDFKVYPNPIESDFTIEYQASKSEDVTFEIFDVEGRSIYTTELKHQDTGFYTKHFGNMNLRKGIYFCNIQTGNFQKTLKVTKL